jgi:hypothetical protein
MTGEKNREFVDETEIFKIPGRMKFYVCVKGVGVFIFCCKRSSV